MWNKKNSKATPAPAAASAANPPPRPSKEAMAAEIEQIKKERDQERKEKEEAQQRADQERQRAEQARQRAVQLERELKEAFVPVRECIAGAPITTKPLFPAWGPLPPGNTASNLPTSSTKTTSAWVDIPLEDVNLWTDSDFETFLRGAENIIVNDIGQPVSLLSVILGGKCNRDLQKILRGNKLGEVIGVDFSSEANLEDWMWRTVYKALESITGEDADPTNISAYRFIHLAVHRGSVNRQQIATVPPQYSPMYKFGKTIEAKILQVYDGKTEEVHERLAHATSRCIVVKKPDFHFLLKFHECNDITEEERKAQNAAVAAGVFSYMKSRFFDTKSNPVAQAVTYAVVSRTSLFMIVTGNQCTYGRVECRGGTKVNVYITKTFRWDQDLKAKPPRLAEMFGEKQWSPFEVLLRFIIAGKGKWFIGNTFPDELKRIFKNNYDGSNASGGKRGGGGGDTKRPRCDPQESEAAPTSQTLPSFKRLYWEDLWDARRFAIPATDPELEGCLDRLDGDAFLIAQSRSGPVYRKTLHGVDTVVKVVVKYLTRGSGSSAVEGSRLAVELEHEADVYDRLQDLQRRGVIPKMLWYGEIVNGMADALATEYAGDCMAGVPSTADMVRGARDALNALHDCDVLHGDVNLRNFVYQQDSDGVMHVTIIDFAFSKFREDMEEDEWKVGVEKECKALELQFPKHLRVDV